MIRLESVSRSFGKVEAVVGLSFSLGQGEIMGFLGTNGAGKTTTIKMLIGLLKPTEGDLLILDEPFTGLDPLARIQFRELMRELRDEGKSIFFSSHELGETELLCDKVAIMKQGTCVYQGPVRDLAGDGGENLERLFLRVLGE